MNYKSRDNIVSHLMKVTQGYLVITTHDGDESTIYFVPENDPIINEVLVPCSGGADADFDALMKKYGCDSEYDIQYYAMTKWLEQNIDTEAFWTQAGCQTAWPFNDYQILGTFYYLTH